MSKVVKFVNYISKHIVLNSDIDANNLTKRAQILLTFDRKQKALAIYISFGLKKSWLKLSGFFHNIDFPSCFYA